jgi:hypothetical protein
MLHSFLKFKADSLAAWPVRAVLLLTGPILLTLYSASAAQAAGLETGPLLQTPAIQCYPVPQQGGSPLDGVPPVSINPVDWIGWVLGQLCKAVATVFFTLTNQVINWGSGCSQAGINFVTQTPNYIRLDAGKADNWQLFFWDGGFIGAALLLQFSWLALTIIWNRQNGNGYAGAQEAVTRTLLGGFLLIISATLLDWSVQFCNLLNGLFASRLTLFDPTALQVDANGNIFNTILAMAAALTTLLLVMQMATRYIYLILLQFVFPLGSVLWINRGTQGYARLIFSSFVATLFVQPLQLAVIYITSSLKDGTRDDTSLSMLFGICGLFLALGLPRVLGSVLGGNTPVGAWGIFAISRMAAGGITSAVRSRGGGGSQSGGNGGPNSGGDGGGGNGGGSGGTGQGKTSSNPSPSPNATAQRQPQNTGANEVATGADESLRYGGQGQTAFRKTSETGATAHAQPQASSSTATAGADQEESSLPSVGSASPITPKPGAEDSQTANPGSDQLKATQASQNANGTSLDSHVAPTTLYRNRKGVIPQRGQDGDQSEVTTASSPARATHPLPGASTTNQAMSEPRPLPKISRAEGYRPTPRRNRPKGEGTEHGL